MKAFNGNLLKIASLETGFLKGPFSFLGQFLATESLFAKCFFFQSTLLVKALFVLKVFKLLPWRFTLVGKRLVKKTRLISKFMTLQTDKQLDYTLPSISRGTLRQSVNEIWSINRIITREIFFIFLQKSCRKWCMKTRSRSLFVFKNIYKVKSSCEHIFQERKELLTWNNQCASFLKGFHWSK